MAQVNHYLAVSGFDCWYIAALIFGKELVIHKIISDKAVLDNLIAEEEHFWKYNVMPEIPPAPTGSEGDTQQINQMYANTDKDKTADLNPVRGLLDKRQELSDQIEQLEQEKTAIEQQVKLKMQDAAYGTAPGYKVSWISSESKRVDAEPKKQPKPKSTSQKQEKPPMPCICVRCNQPIKRVKLKDGSIMQAAEFANTHDGMCAACYKATRFNAAFVKYKWLLIALLMISIIAIPMVVNILFKFSSAFPAEWSAGDKELWDDDLAGVAVVMHLTNTTISGTTFSEYIEFGMQNNGHYHINYGEPLKQTGRVKVD